MKIRLFAFTLLLIALPVMAQNNAKSLAPEEIIKRFTTKESELLELWKDYSYQQISNLQVMGAADTVRGEYYQVSEFVFTDAGQRIQRILKAPPPSLAQAGLTMTAEDQNAFINLQPFALTAENLKDYDLRFINKEKIDALTTYVFDVTPKAMNNRQLLEQLRRQKIEGKYFQGRVWVDDQDFQIVKTLGKTVPEFKQRFPTYETWRENLDGRFWFPTYTYGDDVLTFEDGNRIRVRMIVKYKNYRKFSGDVKIITEGVEDASDPKSEPPQNPAAQPKPKEVKPAAPTVRKN